MADYSADVMLVDLGALFWASWYATGSAPQSFSIVLDRVEGLAQNYPKVIVCADGRRVWRYEYFPDYKANRTKKPEDAIETLSDVKLRLVEGLGLEVIERTGFEADDVIASFVANTPMTRIHILTEDKDLYQLIDDNVSVVTKTCIRDRAGCERKFGVPPHMIRDLLAVWGDASDNVPGCKLWGQAKTAALLHKFGTIEAAKAATAEELCQLPKVGATLANNFIEWDPTLAVKLVSLRYDALDENPATIAPYEGEIPFGRPEKSEAAQ